MRERIRFYIKRIKEGRLQEMWRQTLWIYEYAKKYWLVMIFYTALGFVGSGVSLLLSWVSKDLVDIITGHQPGKLIQTFVFMIGINVFTTLLSQISSYIGSYLSMKVDSEIKSDIFEKILVTDWESLTTYHTGDLLVRWSSDASAISGGVLSFIPDLLINIFRFGSAMVMMAVNDASFIIFAFAGMPVSLILSKTLLKRMVNNNKKSAAMGAKMSGFNQETFANIQTIKAFDLIHLYIDRLRNIQKDYIRMKLDFQKMSIGTSLILSAVGLAVSYASYGWGIHRVWSGAISYGSMTMFLGLSGTLTSTLHSLTNTVPTIISLTTSAGRLMDIVEMPREDYSHDDEVLTFAERNKDEGVSLYIKNLAYAYNNGNQVFRDASLEVSPHEVIALVGPSGEGKTTLIRLILSLMRTQGGEACLCGGKNTPDSAGSNKVELTPSTRRLFSYVPQGNTMFSGTIAQNMRNVKEDATDEEIIEALKMACAWEFVEKLPDGIESEIKERGGGFSEGQAQRLSIARALLRRSPLLLLDEATSALDVKTESRVLKNIMQDEYPRTCIVTTHRPSVLSACNRVYAIQDKGCRILNEEEIKDMMTGEI